MKPLLFVVFWLSILLVLLLGFGIAVGFVLHWLIPAIDLGIGALIGMLAVVCVIDLFSKLMSFMAREREAVDDGGDLFLADRSRVRIVDVQKATSEVVSAFTNATNLAVSLSGGPCPKQTSSAGASR